MMIAFETLRELIAFQGVPDHELTWLVAHSQVIVLPQDDHFYVEGQEVEQFYVVLDGELLITRTMDNQKQVMGTTPSGIIGGELSLLNDVPSVVGAQAIVDSRLLVFDQQAFREIFAACPTFASYIFKVAAERTQGYASYVSQQERMAALGKFAAGLAHELNNPAAAARRAARTLSDLLPVLQTRSLALNSLGLSDAQQTSLLHFLQAALQTVATAMPLPPLEQSDREDEMADWLDEQEIEQGWELAHTLVSAGLEPATLIELLEPLPPAAISPVLNWLNDVLSAAGLLSEVEESTKRISELIASVKSYTYIDQAPMQEVDLHEGLENTLKVMTYKLRDVQVERRYAPELPLIQARGGELNQVWTNLIDNAVDATEGRGKVTLITRHEQDYVMVEVMDNGSGIPPEVQPRLFEPFFTTKDIGKGTGLGLDITYRIVRLHNGTIEVQSQPGQTRFIVRIPITQGDNDEQPHLTP